MPPLPIRAPLRAQRNAFRDFIDLSGLWRFKTDPDDAGASHGWPHGLAEDALDIAVPGSWNEQLAEAGCMNYVGPAWLETAVFIPASFAGKRLALRFGSADYHARVWVNGVAAGESLSPMLPFEVEITDLVTAADTARIVVQVDNRLRDEDLTQRVGPDIYADEGRIRDEYLPAVRFDFFPYGGINRPVHLTATPPGGVAGVAIETALTDGGARVEAQLDVSPEGPAHSATATLRGAGAALTTTTLVERGSALARLDVPHARAWSPDDPFLYDLDITLFDAAGAPMDRYTLPVGIRSMSVEGTRLLLNGAPIDLKGFGKHEEGPIRGRGLDLPMLVKDFHLMRWCGANSFRTSHYPYSEEWLDAADRHGVLVISELFSINLDFRRTTAATLANHLTALELQIARDRNHPSVIMWSLANEPGFLNEPEAKGEPARAYWQALYGRARALDPSRPLTHANVEYCGLEDQAIPFDDVITLNRYFGWYQAPGQLDRAADLLRQDVEALAARFGKPVFIGEFGADAVSGMHAIGDQMWTEEYQARLIEAYWRVIADHPACVGGHVWNFADFRTAQHGRRAVLNHKGVFTRDRAPKTAAFAVRRLWATDDEARRAEKDTP